VSQNPYDPNAQQPEDPYGYGQGNQQGGPGNTGWNGGPGNYPQSGPYQQGGPGYGQGYGRPLPSDGGLSLLTLNLWLSVFFGWIPALIFFLTSRDNATPAVREAHTKNMNFVIIRLIFGVATAIPFIGWIVGGIGSVVLFVFAIINAAQVPGQIRAGRRPEFIAESLTAPNWIK
jgi:uncharacterized membrane protein